MSERYKSCEKCCCIDSKDNPILEEYEGNKLIATICMMCYAETLNED
jgi:hypothetical protein